MSIPQTIADPVADLAVDPIIHFDTNARNGRLSQEFAENADAIKSFKVILAFLGVAQVEWSSLDPAGGNTVPYTQVGVFPSRGNSVRVRVGKYQGVLVNPREVSGQRPLSQHTIMARWSKDGFEQYRRRGSRRPEPPADPTTIRRLEGHLLIEFARTCHERRGALDTIHATRMAVALVEVAGEDFQSVHALNSVLEQGEEAGLIFTMNDERTVFGFGNLERNDFLRSLQAPAASEPGGNIVAFTSNPDPAPEPDFAADTIQAPPTPVTEDLLSLLADTDSKMRERDRLIAHRVTITRKIEENVRLQAELESEKADLEKQLTATGDSVAKFDQLHQALEVLRRLNASM